MSDMHRCVWAPGAQMGAYLAQSCVSLSRRLSLSSFFKLHAVERSVPICGEQHIWRPSTGGTFWVARTINHKHDACRIHLVCAQYKSLASQHFCMAMGI